MRLHTTAARDFYPRSPCGERPAATWYTSTPWMAFLSTLSLRRATIQPQRAILVAAFLSTLSLRRATKSATAAHLRVVISIHALLAESDQTGNATGIHTHWISIHALLAESDDNPPGPEPPTPGFLSTLSLRRATPAMQILISQLAFLSTLSLRRATHTFAFALKTCDYFYPRSPCGERRIPGGGTGGVDAFLSTLSLRRATWQKQKYRRESKISIHALLAESDFLTGCLFDRGAEFLSTLSLRRATGAFLFLGRQPRNFYPRSPCGERQ